MATPIERQKYNISVQLYSLPGLVDVQPRCNSYTFTNLGDVIAKVNGMLIFPAATPATDLGDSRIVEGNANEVFTGTIRLEFDANTAGVNPLVEIGQKYFID